MTPAKFKIRKKDKVMVVSGRDKGKTGDVLKVFPDESRVIVSKVNLVTRHRGPRGNEPGGIQHLEASIHYSNVMLICPKCEKPVRARLGRLPDGKSVRLCRKCGETIL